MKQESPEDRFKSVAWSVAIDCAIASNKDVLEIYSQIMKSRGLNNSEVPDESDKSY